MEQLCGTPPYRFEPVGAGEARIVEEIRRGVMGGWRPAKRRVRWVTCQVGEEPAGTVVIVEASKGAGAATRAVQLVDLLSRGDQDRRTVYRNRAIPEGPISLVASWAGTPYTLFNKPAFDADRGSEIFTATPIVAIGGSVGSFVKVRLSDGTEGFVERDQIVPAPAVATRAAQTITATRG